MPAPRKTSERPFVRDLADGDNVDTVFLVARKDVKTDKNGNAYLDLEVQDKTGVIPLKFWRVPAGVADTVRAQGFLRVKGRVKAFNNKPQIDASVCVAVPDADARIEDYLPASPEDPEALLERLAKILATVKNPHLSRLAAAFLDDADFVARFRRAPAAMKQHHACLGGLLDHTVSSLESGALVAGHYPWVDRDLVLTGLFLHDIGKMAELACDRAIAYTDTGELLGHIEIGAEMTREKIRALGNFPKNLETLLIHIILSHHGSHEWGSPRLPVTAEALVVHTIENLDAKLNSFKTAVDTPSGPDEHWTAWNNTFDRKLFRGFPPENTANRES
ncbi:MAG: HD domain-containing protein [Planctomycetota bacterium]